MRRSSESVSVAPPRSVAKRPERGLGRRRPLLVSYLGLKAWRRDAIFGFRKRAHPSLTSATKDQWAAGSLPAAHLHLSDVVIRRDVHMGSFTGHVFCSVATRKVQISIFRDVAVVVEIRIVGCPESQSSTDHTGGVVAFWGFPTRRQTMAPSCLAGTPEYESPPSDEVLLVAYAFGA